MEQLGAGRLTCKESLGEEVIFTMQGIFWGRIQGFWLTHYLGEHTESFICFSGNLEKYKYERYWVLKVWKSQVNLSLYPDPYRNRAFINLIIQYIYLKKTRTHNIQKTIFFYSSSPIPSSLLVPGEMSFENSSRKNVCLLRINTMYFKCYFCFDWIFTRLISTAIFSWLRRPNIESILKKGKFLSSFFIKLFQRFPTDPNQSHFFTKQNIF